MKLTFSINFIFLLLIGNNIKNSEQYNVKLRLGLCSYTLTNEKTAKTKISGAYWRPYTGVIPTDAIPGAKIKNSVGYVGAVYDPVNHGEFLTTICPGENGVTVTMNKTSTLHHHIQILCSEEKEKFQWLALTDPKTSDGTLVYGGSKSGYQELYVAQVKAKNRDIFVGNIHESSEGVLYTTSDGKAGKTNNTDEYKILFYFNNSNSPVQKESFITYSFHTSFKNPTGPAYFPNFHYMVKVWNLIAVCTDVQNSPGNEIAYYWKYQQANYIPDDAFLLGQQYNNYKKKFQSKYVGQGYYAIINEIVQGTFGSDQKLISSGYPSAHAFNSFNLFGGGKILCTSNNHTFKWVNTTMTDGLELLHKAVLGGITNVSKIYIARVMEKESYYLANLYPSGDNGKPKITYIDDYRFYDKIPHFEILTYDGPKTSNSEESFLSTLWRYLGVSLTL